MAFGAFRLAPERAKAATTSSHMAYSAQIAHFTILFGLVLKGG
jgi:hypothetical protein